MRVTKKGQYQTDYGERWEHTQYAVKGARGNNYPIHIRIYEMQLLYWTSLIIKQNVTLCYCFFFGIFSAENKRDKGRERQTGQSEHSPISLESLCINSVGGCGSGFQLIWRSVVWSKPPCSLNVEAYLGKKLIPQSSPDAVSWICEWLLLEQIDHVGKLLPPVSEWMNATRVCKALWLVRKTRKALYENQSNYLLCIPPADRLTGP